MSLFTPKRVLLVLLLAILGWVSVRYLVPIAMPFLLAALLAVAAEPLVSALQKRLHLPRAAATGIGVSISVVLLILILMVLGALLVRQLNRLMGVVPDLEGTALQGMDSLESWLLTLAAKAPKGVSPMR